MTAAGCEVWFYHLERSPLEQVLPLLEAAFQASAGGDDLAKAIED